MRKKAEEKGIKAYDSIDNLLNVPDLHAIMVCSPPQFHATQAIAALEAGKHVYSEVPMALKKEDVEKIVNTADKVHGTQENPKTVYHLGENYCFLSEVLYAGYLSDSGIVGKGVYAESEYIHDVSYRWLKSGHGDLKGERVKSWYSQFDPLAYGHSIGPAQVALGGIKKPMPFTEVVSYGNSNGDLIEKPLCDPAHAFHVALFRTETNAIAKCANAYVIAREPTRLMIQLIGERGSYECYQLGKAGNLFQADDHIITNHHHRKGTKQKIGYRQLKKVIPSPIGGFFSGMLSGNTRCLGNWIESIEKGCLSAINPRVAANFCLAGIASSEASRTNKTVQIPQL
jgi:predicted dehydrogenase